MGELTFSIPKRLKSLSRFNLWRRHGKRKIPVCTEGKAVSPVEPDMWTTFDEVHQALRTNKDKFDGIAFLRGDVQILDIDNATDDDGKVRTEAQKILDLVGNSLPVEVSPSGSGYHIYFRSALKLEGAKRDYVFSDGTKLEWLSHSGFSTITGNWVQDPMVESLDNDDLIQKIRDGYFNGQESNASPVAERSSISLVDKFRHYGCGEDPSSKVLHMLKSGTADSDHEQNNPPFQQLANASIDLSKYPSLNASAENNRLDRSKAVWILLRKVAYLTGRDKLVTWKIVKNTPLGTDLTSSRSESWLESETEKAIDSTPQIFDWDDYFVTHGYSQTPIEERPSAPSTLTVANPDNGLSDRDSHILREFALTDDALAIHFTRKYGESIRYVGDMDEWRVYNGKFWESADDILIRKYIRELKNNFVDELRQTADRYEVDRLCDLIKNLCSNHRQKAIVDYCKTELYITSDVLDRHWHLLNCSNGVVDLRNGEVLPHDPKYFITMYIDIPYESNVYGKKWTKFLQDVTNHDNSMIEFLQRSVGYGATGETSEQCLFILHGNGGNGKSTLVETVQGVLAGYAIGSDQELLSGERNNHPTGIARLRGARFVSGSEPSGNRINEPLVKKLTGSDTITARYMHRNFFDFQPNCKFYISLNNLPAIVGTDDGIWRRVKKIEFDYKVGEKDRIAKFSDVLIKEESEAILAWIVDGAVEWYEHGLSPPDSVIEATRNYREDMDIVFNFINEKCEVGTEYEVKSSDLYRSYKMWCEDSGHFDIKQRKFNNELVNKGYIKKKNSTTFFEGLKLQDADNPVPQILTDDLPHSKNGESKTAKLVKIPCIGKQPDEVKSTAKGDSD